MGWGGRLILSTAQKTKFRRSQISHHPNPSPALQRSVNSNKRSEIQEQCLRQECSVRSPSPEIGSTRSGPVAGIRECRFCGDEISSMTAPACEMTVTTKDSLQSFAANRLAGGIRAVNILKLCCAFKVVNFCQFQIYLDGLGS